MAKQVVFDEAARRALKRGIEAVYQLEESELMAEPLPGRDNLPRPAETQEATTPPLDQSASLSLR